MRRWLHALLLMLAAFGSLAAVAQTEPAPVWSPRGTITAQYWLDASGVASLAVAQAAFDSGQGGPVDFRRITPFGPGRAAWYRLQLPPATAPTEAVLAVPFPGIDAVELFLPDDAGGWRVQRAGDSLPVNQWAMRYLHPAFSFTVLAGQGQTAFLRLQHSHPLGVNWVLWDASSFDDSAKLWHLVLGAGAGFMLLVVMLSVSNAWTWRDAIHLYYAVHVVLFGLTFMSLTGIAGEYLWPGNAWWNDLASIALPAASLGWMGVLVRELVAERGRRFVSLALLVHVAICALMVLGFFVIGRQGFPIPSVYALFSLFFIVAVLAWYSMRRPQVGLWVLAGMSLLVVGALFALMRNLGFLPVSFLTQYGPQIGGALEVPLVLVGLYFRSRERRDNRVRLEALAHTDPLTGVANHRVLLERLEQLLRRARRNPELGAVIRIQLANLAAIRGKYGREAAEAALVRAAECVALEAAEGDLVAREQGGDLVLVMEGKLTRAQAAEAARNIIARGLKFSGRLPPSVTLTLRAAGTCAPLPDGGPDGVLVVLARTLRELGNGRALRILEPADVA